MSPGDDKAKSIDGRARTVRELLDNPSRLDLDGEKPPVPEPILEADEAEDDAAERPKRYEARLDFWTALLERAKQVSDLHERISPDRYGWCGARRHGHGWNYVVLQNETRVELYIDGPDSFENKALFDGLHSERAAIEREFGDRLLWQRMDDKRASRISFTVPGGWVDRDTWNRAIEKAVDAMNRFYKTLGPRVQTVRGASA